MNNFNKTLSRQNTALRAIISILAGIVLLLLPELTLQYIIALIGAMLLGFGIVGIISYFRRPKDTEAPVMIPFGGIICSVLGLIMLITPATFVNVFMILLGVILLIGALGQLIMASSYYRYAPGVSPLIFLYPLVILICSIVIMVNPFASAAGLLMFFGISIILYGVVDLIAYFRLRKFIRQNDKTPEV